MSTITGTSTNDGKNLSRDAGKGVNAQFKYVALGTSNATPTANDHTLGAEIYRKAITSYTNGSQPGELIVNVYFGAGEVVGANIEEIAIFAGTSATSAANSGVMMARALFHLVGKTNQQDIVGQFSYKFQ